MFDKFIEISMLYGFYGGLLPEKQNLFLKAYYEDDCSLSEIAEQYGISRQGVHDGIKKAEKSLKDYEEKLGLVSRFLRTTDVLNEIDGKIDQLVEKYKDNQSLIKQLKSMLPFALFSTVHKDYWKRF